MHRISITCIYDYICIVTCIDMIKYIYKVIYTRALAQNCLDALWSGVRQRKLDLEQQWNYTWSLPFWDKTKWTLMELSDSMTTTNQAIDAKEPDGLMEGVWAKGALGGLDDGQRLLHWYFFENHWTWYIKTIRIKKTLEWFEKQVACFSSKKGVASNSRSDCCCEGSAPSSFEIRLKAWLQILQVAPAFAGNDMTWNASKPFRNRITFCTLEGQLENATICGESTGKESVQGRGGQRACSVRSKSFYKHEFVVYQCQFCTVFMNIL